MNQLLVNLIFHRLTAIIVSMNTYEAKSLRNTMNHHEFVFALIPFSHRIVTELGHAHVIVELNCAPERVLDCLEKGFGLTLITCTVDENGSQSYNHITL